MEQISGDTERMSGDSSLSLQGRSSDIKNVVATITILLAFVAATRTGPAQDAGMSGFLHATNLHNFIAHESTASFCEKIQALTCAEASPQIAEHRHDLEARRRKHVAPRAYRELRSRWARGPWTATE